MAEQALGYHPFLDPIPYKEPKVLPLQDHFRMPRPHLHARTTFTRHGHIRVAGPRLHGRKQIFHLGFYAEQL